MPIEGVERAGRAAAGGHKPPGGQGHAPTLGQPAPRSLNTRDLITGFALLLAACLAGATAWALIMFALIGALL